MEHSEERVVEKKRPQTNSREKPVFIESPKLPKKTEQPKTKQQPRPLFLLPPLNWRCTRDEDKREYTLVLDLDETLVHFDHRTRLF